jgi:PKD repeat protein
MKRISTLLFASILFSGPMLAQDIPLRQHIPSPGKHVSTNARTATVTCGNDTILYPYLKELVFAGQNDSFFVDAMVGNVRVAAQAYHFSSPVNVVGVQFWGGAYSTNPNFVQSMPVRVMLYNVDAQNMPISVIDSATVFTGTGYNWHRVNFIAPVTVTGNFAVGVKNELNDTLAVITNNAGNVWTTTNYAESLAWRRFGSGTWNSSASFFGQDLEYMVFPIISYNVTSSYTGPDTICEGSTANFTNTSTDLFGNRFINLHAFDDYWGLSTTDSTFTWNYGDGPGWSYSMNGIHTYSTAGTYDVKLAGEILGYYTTCSDTMTMTLNVVTPMASFSVDNSLEPTISFTNISSSFGSTTYMWDFGDGNTSTAQNPSHTYSNLGTYTVTLTVTDSCGTITGTQTVTINTVGVNEASGVHVSAFFNTTENVLNVSLPASSNATVEVYNAIGSLICSESGVNTATKVISLNGVSSGTYMVRVKTANGIGAAKFAVIR